VILDIINSVPYINLIQIGRSAQQRSYTIWRYRMPILRISKEQLEKAREAREAALKKDPEFRDFEKEQERQRKEATKEQEQQKAAA
jgi:hypothetical protein